MEWNEEKDDMRIVASTRTVGQATIQEPLGNLFLLKKSTLKEHVNFSIIGFTTYEWHIIVLSS